MKARTVEIRKGGKGARLSEAIPAGALLKFVGENRAAVKIEIIPEPTPLVGLDGAEANSPQYSNA